MSEVKQDLHISTKAEMPGGTFSDVHISGQGVINGDLTCEQLKVSGSGRLNGNVKTFEMKVSGKVDLEETLVSQVLKVSGSLKSNGSIHCQEELKVSGQLKNSQHIAAQNLKVSGKLSTEGSVEVTDGHISGVYRSETLTVKQGKISGIATINKSLSAHELKVSGHLTVGDSIEAEQLKVTGRLNCEGFINSEKVELEGNSKSTFNEIGASEVKIIRYYHRYPINSVFSSMINGLSEMFGSSYKVSGNLIEADSVYVESANIKKISGHDVVIGPNCIIDEVDYTGTLSVDKESLVKQSSMR